MGDSTALRFIALKTKSESNTTELLHIKTSCICTVTPFGTYCIALQVRQTFSSASVQILSIIRNFNTYCIICSCLLLGIWKWLELAYNTHKMLYVCSLTSKCQSCNCGLTVLNLLQRGLKRFSQLQKEGINKSDER